ncbi:MAG: ribosome-associated translation inhibitor RaiA [Candidatus Sericytochromatia bacterium]
MKFIIHGKNVEVTDALRDYVKTKLGKMEKYSRHIVDVNVELSVAKNPRIKNNQQVTVTTSVNGLMLRSEESSVNMYAAIDLVGDKLERQLIKYERKRTDRSAAVKTAVAMGEMVEDEDEAEESTAVAAPAKKKTATAVTKKKTAAKAPVKRKVKNERLAIKPMSPEEAAAQMELLKYTFLLFRNQDSNDLNIIFKLDGKNKEYGVIIPNESVDEAIVMRL